MFDYISSHHAKTVSLHHHHHHHHEKNKRIQQKIKELKSQFS